MKVLSWTDKHSTTLYDASSKAKLEAASRAILRLLLEMTYIYEPDKPRETSEDEAAAMALSEAEVEALPEVIRSKILPLRTARAKRQKEYESELEEYELIKAVAFGTPPLRVFRLRKRYNDEEWEKVLTAVRERFSDAVIEEDRVLRPASAWAILQDRNGYEYEMYDLMDVVTVEA